MRMHTQGATFIFKLIVACAISLALPASASAFTVTADAPSVAEGNAGTTDAKFTLACELLDVGLPTVAPQPGTPPAATAGSDFEPDAVASPALLPCALVPLSQTVTVKVIGDTLDEPNENVKLEVTLGATTKSAQVTITDDDVPTASIVDVVRVAEGDSGTAATQLMVSLSQIPVADATIDYATENASAVSGADYSATSGQLVIPAGQTTGTIAVPIVGDTTPEQVEAFFVNLANPITTTLDPTKKQTTVVIFDNDLAPLPTVSLPKSVSVEEGNSGTGNILFNVTLSSNATERTEVRWKTGDWTANNGADYKNGSGKVVFQAGQKSKTISVDVKGDRRDEPDEAFTVTLLENPVAATLGRKAAFGIIEDDDGPKMRIGKPKLRGKRLVTKLGCPDTASGCKGRLVGKAGKLKLGRKKFDLAKGAEKKLKLKLSRKARKALAKKRRRAKLTATAADTSGDTRVTTRKARLRRLR
jgi:hypothetical protein